MTRIIVFILVVWLFCRCSGKDNQGSMEIDTTPIYMCEEPGVTRIYVEQGCNLDKCSYVHTLMLNSYSDSCFNEINFVGIADRYLDSVRQQLPISEIVFVRPFDFRPTYDSGDNDPLNDNSIVEISYLQDTIKKELPIVDGVSFWVNGDKKTIDNMDLVHRLETKKRTNEPN